MGKTIGAISAPVAYVIPFYEGKSGLAADGHFARVGAGAAHGAVGETEVAGKGADVFEQLVEVARHGDALQRLIPLAVLNGVALGQQGEIAADRVRARVEAAYFRDDNAVATCRSSSSKESTPGSKYRLEGATRTGEE